MKKNIYSKPETVCLKLSIQSPLLGISNQGNPNSGQDDDGGGAKATGLIFDEDGGWSNSLWEDDDIADDDF
jgi:hypothetical protein